MIYKYLHKSFQLTWLPNEVENYDFVLVEFLDRVLSPKSKNTINVILLLH